MPASRFPAQLYAMVSAGFEEIGWTNDGDGVWISNPERLASTIIPQFFDHASYASLHRSLNSYDFHKATPSVWKHPLFRRGHPEDLDKIHRKHLNRAQQSIKSQLDSERKKAALLQAKAKQLEEELRQLQEADAVGQEKLRELQQRAELASRKVEGYMRSPLMPSFLDEEDEPDVKLLAERVDTAELELELNTLKDEDVSLETLQLTRDDLKPQAARIIDDDLAELFGGKCSMTCPTVWENFEAAAALTEDDLREVFAELAGNHDKISRAQFQAALLGLWRLGPGTPFAEKCPHATGKLAGMFQALEHAAQEGGRYCDESLSVYSAVGEPCGVLSEESLRTGTFGYEEFRAILHAWKEWYGWKKDTIPTLPSPAKQKEAEEELKVEHGDDVLQDMSENVDMSPVSPAP